MNKFIKFVVMILSIALLCFCAVRAAKWCYPKEHGAYVEQYAAEYGLSGHLVYAMIKAESNFDHEAKSVKNASGLMQIMEPTGAWIAQKLGMQDYQGDWLTDPETNIQMGCYYISYLLDMYDGDKKCALAAYNAGHANVDSWLLDKAYSKDGTHLYNIPFSETEQYVNLVLKNEKVYDFLYRNE